MTPLKLPISVIVPVRNEARNIGDCLRSLEWADEVFVVDSQSTDETARLAGERGATVVQFYYKGEWPKKKNWAIRNLPLRNDWILIVDADERMTPELADEIGMAIRQPGYNGFYIRWKFMFLGSWMRHCWSHGWMLRLFRKGTGEYEDLGMRNEGGWDNEVHENIVVSGRTGKLRKLLLHETREDLSYWIRKQNEFSDWNAIRRLKQLSEPLPPFRSFFSPDPLTRRKWAKAVYLRLPAKPGWMFLYLYVLKGGFMDGASGLYFCALRAVHELNISAKIFERKRIGRHPSPSPAGKPTVLLLSRCYLPSYKAGGPVRSLAALVRRLSDSFHFLIVAQDRDAGDTRPFAGLVSNVWSTRDGVEVRYLSPGKTGLLSMIALIRRTSYDLLYLNSFFDPFFAIAPLLAGRLGLLPRKPILLAPRGELSPGALAQKNLKKRLFIRFAAWTGLYRRVLWQASSEEEKRHILEVVKGDRGLESRIRVARNLAMEPPVIEAGVPRSPKQAGSLRAVFLSRISPKKNLIKAIELLSRVRGRVSLDIYGYISDPAYWRQCLDEAARHPELTVVYQGAIPHETVVERLRDYEVFLFPTLGENFGHVILESLLAGCPVCVSTSTPWQSLEAEGAGWVVPLDWEDAFVRALQAAADMDETAHAKMREAAGRVGREALHDRRPVEDNLRLFQEALMPPNPGDPHAG